jgi:hypothetical protein
VPELVRQDLLGHFRIWNGKNRTRAEPKHEWIAYKATYECEIDSNLMGCSLGSFTRTLRRGIARARRIATIR